jgi:hypothetical protein
VTQQAEFSGLDRSLFMTIEDARKFYDLSYRESLFMSDSNAALERDGIIAIDMPLSGDDFATLLEGYEECIEECPEILKETYHQVDFRHGKDAGQVRKERKMHKGVQVADPKNYFHFNEYASRRWAEQFLHGPRILRRFLAEGAEVQVALIDTAKQQFLELEETHPNITRAHFCGSETKPVSCSFMRLLSYDGYTVDEHMGDVGKPHFDIGNATIQAYADAPGFWVAPDGPQGERQYYPNNIDEGYFFISYAHKKLYGDSSPLKPLWHGVERLVPPNTVQMPKRHAVILFVDTPYVDDSVRPEETVPYAGESAVA